MEQPAYYWDPVIAPSGMIVYHGALFPQWQGSILAGGLTGLKLVRLQMDGDRVVGEEWLLQDHQGVSATCNRDRMVPSMCSPKQVSSRRC